MRIHYLVEGPSEQALLQAWLRRAVPAHRHCVYPHEGKGKLSLVAAWQACNPAPVGKIRIAVEETEAFYLGDQKAIRAAFKTFHSPPFNSYVQDDVCGTWEVFQSVIGWTVEAKVNWARAMAATLSTATSGPELNSSPSFQAFYRAVKELVGEPWP